MRRAHTLTVLAACLSLLTTSPVLAGWMITLPTSGSNYTTTSVVSGSGPADGDDVGEVGTFAFGSATFDGNGEVTGFTYENFELIAPTTGIPGTVVWSTSTGQLAPPTGGWAPSPVNGMGIRIPDHAAQLIEPDLPMNPVYQKPMTVYP